MIRSLAGVRVVDLSWVWAGPSSTRILADLGADVVKIEAPQRPDSVRALVQDRNTSHPDYWNHAGYFIEKNLGKRGMTLNLGSTEGRDIFLMLVARSHVVVESFSPRVMEQLGLSFAKLREVQPKLVMVSLSGYGATGPHRNRTAYGAALEAESGITSTIGYDGGPPVKSGLAYTDPLSGVLAAGAILHALYRQECGELAAGIHIDLAERDVAVPLVTEQLAAFQLDNKLPERIGNRHETYAPQGCFACAGNDRWVAITVRSDTEWYEVAQIIERPDIAGLSLAERRQRETELHELIAAFCRNRFDRDVVSLLQSRGVPVAPIQDGRDLLEDPQLRQSNFFTDITDTLVGTKPFFRFLGARFEKTMCAPSGPAPHLDEHTEAVLRELEFDADSISGLRDRGVWGHHLTPGARSNLGLPLQLLREIGAVTEIDALPAVGSSKPVSFTKSQQRIDSVEEFLAIASEYFRVQDRSAEAQFISGETFPAALTRWWVETIELHIPSRNVFEWTCPGCRSRVKSAGAPLYSLPLFDYALWDFCPTCAAPAD